MSLEKAESDLYFKGIKVGLIKNKNKRLNLIKIYKLVNCLNKRSDYPRIAKAMAYSIVNEPSKRNTIAWQVFKNSYSYYKAKNFKHLAIVENAKIKSFEDLIAIDFSNYLSTVVPKYPTFARYLYKELEKQ